MSIFEFVTPPPPGENLAMCIYFSPCLQIWAILGHILAIFGYILVILGHIFGKFGGPLPLKSSMGELLWVTMHFGEIL